MITTICSGDWLQFQVIKHGALVTDEGYVTADPECPKWLWAGDRIVADSDGKQIGTIIVLAHAPANPDDPKADDDPIDRVARAIAEADDNSRPGCVYVKLAEAAMAAGGAK